MVRRVAALTATILNPDASMRWNPLAQVPSGNRELAMTAALTLFLTMAGHAVLETARDAIFLSSIPASELPFVYIAIAVASLGVSRAVSFGRRAVDPAHLLSGWIGFKALVTVGFGVLLTAGAAQWSFYVLYVWSGIAVTVTLLQLFIILGELSTVQDAKASFTMAGTGSALGAIVGSAVAVLLAGRVDDVMLVFVAAGLFATAIAGAVRIARSGAESLDTERTSTKTDSFMAILRDVAERPYVRSLGALIAATTVTVTLADYIFKAETSAGIDPTKLAMFFGVFYLVTNVASFVIQAFAVRTLFRRATVTGSLTIMPVLMLLASVGFAITGGLVAAVGLRGIDGALRHSLQRTATEVLYVPMRGAVRKRVKAFLDIIGHRGAQAVTSAGILAGIALGATNDAFGWAAVGAASLWVIAALSVRSRYLNVFRERLREAVDDQTLDFPDLDVASLESLVETLNDSDDRRVIAALDLLVAEGKQHLVPALIVYHPSEDVVVRALEVFAESGRTDFIPHAMRIAQDTSEFVCSSMVSAIARTGPRNVEALRARLEEGRPGPSAVAAIYLNDAGELEADEARTWVHRAMQEAPSARLAVIKAIGDTRNDTFEAQIRKLMESPDPDVGLAAIEAARRLGGEQMIEALRNLLRNRVLRDAVREALVETGEQGRTLLLASLADRSLPSQLRRQLPGALGEFGPEVADSMLCVMEDEADGMVRYRIVRTLEHLKLEHRIELQPDIIERSIDETLRRAWHHQHARRIATAFEAENAGAKSQTRSLLVEVLRDKQRNAFDLVLRMLGLLHGGEDFPSIRRSLSSEHARVAASSRELLEHLVDSERRDAVLGLLDTNDVDSPYEFEETDYTNVIASFLDSDSRLLRVFAVRTIGELRIDELRHRLDDLPVSGDQELEVVLSRAREQFGLETPPQRPDTRRGE